MTELDGQQIVGLLALGAAVLVLLNYNFRLRRKLMQSEKRLGDHQARYRCRKGALKGIGPYEIRSLDGGRNWCACRSMGEQVIILGEASRVYPHLLEQILNRKEAYWSAPLSRTEGDQSAGSLFNEIGLPILEN